MKTIRFFYDSIFFRLLLGSAGVRNGFFDVKQSGIPRILIATTCWSFDFCESLENKTKETVDGKEKNIFLACLHNFFSFFFLLWKIENHFKLLTFIFLIPSSRLAKLAENFILNRIFLLSFIHSFCTRSWKLPQAITAWGKRQRNGLNIIIKLGRLLLNCCVCEGFAISFISTATLFIYNNI